MIKHVTISELAKQTGRDRANLLKKAKKETVVINRVIKTPGGWQLCATVPLQYAKQLLKIRAEQTKLMVKN
jgi:hypothetical protein